MKSREIGLFQFLSVISTFYCPEFALKVEKMRASCSDSMYSSNLRRQYESLIFFAIQVLVLDTEPKDASFIPLEND